MKCCASQSKQYIRYFNATNVSDINFYMFNKLEFSKSYPGEVSEYKECEYGTTSYKITLADGSQIASGFSQIKPEGIYTVCAVGSNENISVYVIDEKPKKSDSSYAHLRICMLNNCCQCSELIANGQKIICDIKPMDISNYVAFICGTYRFEIIASKDNASKNSSGTDEFYVKLDKIHLNAGERYSIYLIAPNKDSNKPTAIIL